MRVELGSVPEWIAAVGTAGAFIFAVIVFQRDLRGRRYDGLRAQARLVDAWVSGAAWARSGGRTDELLPKIILTVALSNASPQAIRTVDIDATFGGAELSPLMCHIVPPTDAGLPEHRTFEIPLPGSTPGSPPDRFLSGMFKTKISFTDAGGNKWSRNEQGDLVLIGEGAAS